MRKSFWPVLALLLFLSPSVFSKPLEITWLIDDGPPFFITNGERKNTGICDSIQRHIIAALPDIKHSTLEIPGGRVGYMMNQGNPVCFSCMIHASADSEESTYSLPNVVYPPHMLITTDTQRKRLQQLYESPVSISQLLDDDRLIFAKHSGRRFGGSLQPIIDQKSDSDNTLLLHNEGGSTSAILDLIRIGRAQYTIEYSAIVSYYNQNNTQPLVALPIQENAEQLVYGAIGCSTSAKNNFAKNAITAINGAFKTLLQDDAYRKDIQYWFTVDDAKYQKWLDEMHRKYFDAEQPG